MLEITNLHRGPIQIVVRPDPASNPRSTLEFTTQIVPGIGAKKNVIYIKDELVTEYIYRLERDGFIKTKFVPNKY